MLNRILLTDSYKVSHWKQYPPGTTNVYSYFESRGGLFKETVFFGLQYILKEYMLTPLKSWEISRAALRLQKHVPGLFNGTGWMHILHDHQGNFPLLIKAVPEGTVVPTGNVLMTIENTCPQCYWVTNYFESLLVQTWYPSTVATLSREMKRVILAALEKSGDPGLVDFKLHDFGFRGTSSVESSLIGGMSHLLNFFGTDTLTGLEGAADFYGEECAGYSIPAAEHSTITSWGRTGEREAYENMLAQYPQGLVAVVSDSYDIFTACSDIWGKHLRDKVLGRDGTVIIRPDSGVPHEVVPKVLDILGSRFGYTTNEKFYKVLDPHVRVIQGDGIDYEETKRILGAIMQAGWSADNVAFGMGGGLLQKLDRDTQKYAFKCSSIIRDGETVDVFKQPVGATWKRSKAGRLALDRRDMTTKPQAAVPEWEDMLIPVYENGKLLVEHKFKEVRERCRV